MLVEVYVHLPGLDGRISFPIIAFTNELLPVFSSPTIEISNSFFSNLFNNFVAFSLNSSSISFFN